MGRPPLVDRDIALDRIMRQFWTTGYEATSLEDLLRVSGMHRGSFYRTFGDKRQAFDAALARYLNRVTVLDVVPALESGGSARRRLEQLMLRRLDDAVGGDQQDVAAVRPGCLVLNTVLELAPHDAQVRGVVAFAQEGMRSAFARLVTESIDCGESARDIEADLVADELFTLLQGAIVAVRAGRDPDSLRNLLRRALDTLLPMATAKETV